MKKRRAQSILEYLLIFAGITLAILYGVKAVITPKAKAQMDKAGSAYQKATDVFSSKMGI